MPFSLTDVRPISANYHRVMRFVTCSFAVRSRKCWLPRRPNYNRPKVDWKDKHRYPCFTIKYDSSEQRDGARLVPFRSRSWVGRLTVPQGGIFSHFRSSTSFRNWFLHSEIIVFWTSDQDFKNKLMLLLLVEGNADDDQPDQKEEGNTSQNSGQNVDIGP